VLETRVCEQRAGFLLPPSGMPSLSRICLLLVALPACAYRPDTLSVVPAGPDAGQLRTVGCLDFAISPLIDPEAEGPAVELTFANRCDEAVVVDLGAIRATAVLGDGSRFSLWPYDPDSELRRATLDARARATENIEYQLPASLREHPQHLCLDISAVDSGARPGPRVVACVRATGVADASEVASSEPDVPSAQP